MSQEVSPARMLVQVNHQAGAVILRADGGGRTLSQIVLTPEQVQSVITSMSDGVALLAGGRDPEPGETPCAVCGKANVPGHVNVRKGDNLCSGPWICSRHPVWEIIRAGFMVDVEDTRGE